MTSSRKTALTEGRGGRGPTGRLQQRTPYPRRSWDCRTTMSFLITKFPDLARDARAIPRSNSSPTPSDPLLHPRRRFLLFVSSDAATRVCSRRLMDLTVEPKAGRICVCRRDPRGQTEGKRGKAAVKDAPDIRGIYEATGCSAEGRRQRLVRTAGEAS